jgi:DnaK suppressor protein
MQQAKPEYDEQAVRAALNEERERSLSSLQALKTEELAMADIEATEGSGFGDAGDVGSELANREVDIALENNVQQRIQDVEAALERLDNGTYGICVDCGQPIMRERLEALPWADRCINCQRREEVQPSNAA